LEQTAALLVQATKDRDAAKAEAVNLAERVRALEADVASLGGERKALADAAAEREKIADAALADANRLISMLEPEAGVGNGPPTEWLTLVQVDPEDFRVLRLVTRGVPPRAMLGESSADRAEAEDRFRAAAGDLFDRLEREGK